MTHSLSGETIILLLLLFYFYLCVCVCLNLSLFLKTGIKLALGESRLRKVLFKLKNMEIPIGNLECHSYMHTQRLEDVNKE